MSCSRNIKNIRIGYKQHFKKSLWQRCPAGIQILLSNYKKQDASQHPMQSKQQKIKKIESSSENRSYFKLCFFFFFFINIEVKEGDET